MFSLVLVEIKLDIAGTDSERNHGDVFRLLCGILTLFMFIGTMRRRNETKAVFASLAVTFSVLAIADFSGNGTMTTVAGFVRIFCGLSVVSRSPRSWRCSI